MATIQEHANELHSISYQSPDVQDRQELHLEAIGHLLLDILAELRTLNDFGARTPDTEGET